MKTHFYILLMLGMVFLLGCEDEKLGTDLGVTNVVLPDISEESLGTEITIQGNGFIDCDVLALSPLSGGTDAPPLCRIRSQRLPFRGRTAHRRSRSS